MLSAGIATPLPPLPPLLESEEEEEDLGDGIIGTEGVVGVMGTVRGDGAESEDDFKEVVEEVRLDDEVCLLDLRRDL